jgi:uncharacterized protein with HEPN domain
MTRGIAARLLDAIEAIDEIEQITAGLTWADFEAQRVIRLAVERLVGNIGEAIARAEELDESLSAKIPEIRQVVGARNQMVHGYWNIDPEILWEIAVDKGPRLRETLRDLLDEYS